MTEPAPISEPAPVEKPKRKRARKAKATTPPATPAPKRERFSLSKWIDERKAVTGLPVDLALYALGQAFAADLRRAIGAPDANTEALDARIERLAGRLARLQEQRAALSTRHGTADTLKARLDAVAETIKHAAGAKP